MKLPFDENLAARLVPAVDDVFPHSAHVRDLGLIGASDRAIWDSAAAGGFVLVTKDEDFHRLSVMIGPPPKVVWIRLGNCTTAAVIELLRAESARITSFCSEPEPAFLALG